MNDIAKESHYAVGTIYIYFKDKNDLYFTLMKRKMEGMIESVKSAVDGVASKDKIKTLIEYQLRSFERDKDFFKIFCLRCVRQNIPLKQSSLKNIWMPS